MDYITPSGIRLSWLDRIIGAISPSRMEGIIRNAVATQTLAEWQRSTYKAAETTRQNYNWATGDVDINLALSTELPVMRRRCRWLSKNNPYAKSAKNTMLNYCVGVGFDLQMATADTIIGPDGPEIVEADEYNEEVEAAFMDWARDVNVAASDQCPDSLYDIQRMAMDRLFDDGEVFIHMTPDRAKIMQLEFIEPEALDTLMTEWRGNPVILGVECDKRTWKPLAYWIRSANASLSGYVWTGENVRVPASNMVHRFVRHHPRQLRGVPWLHAVQDKLFQLEQYSDAQLVRNRIAAVFGVLFKGGPAGKLLDTASTAWPVDSNGNKIQTLSPGIMGSLPEGVEPVQINPTAPGGEFTQFMQTLLISVGAGIEFGMSYQGLTRDTSQTTFASGRSAGQMDMQGYRPLQNFFSRGICSPMFSRWHDYAAMFGAISGKGRDYELRPEYWKRHAWLPGGWSWGINPTQEVSAAEQSMKNRISTLADECSQLGRDWRVQLRMTAKVQKYAKQLGVTLPENVEAAKEAELLEPKEK